METSSLGNKASMEDAKRKLPKAERREQLLETAMTIVREQGTDAMTLGYLAERALVSKPVVYDHFGTRSGMLIALYGRIDERHVTMVRHYLARVTGQIAEVARVDCHTERPHVS